MPIRRYLTLLPVVIGFWAIVTCAHAEDDVALGASPTTKGKAGSTDKRTNEQLELERSVRELQELGKSQAQPKGSATVGNRSVEDPARASAETDRRAFADDSVAGRPGQEAAWGDSGRREHRRSAGGPGGRYSEGRAARPGTRPGLRSARRADRPCQDPGAAAAVDAPRALQPDEKQRIALVNLRYGRSIVRCLQ